MLAVRNFGHYWSREHVSWGRPHVSGELLGYIMEDRKPFVVNFRDQIAIYVLFTATREVIYVGQSGSGDQRLFLRLRNHMQNYLRDRWEYFSWFGLRAVNDTRELSNHQKPESKCGGVNADALDEIEAVLLQLYEPRLNKQGPRWGDETWEYFQYIFPMNGRKLNRARRWKTYLKKLTIWKRLLQWQLMINYFANGNDSLK